MYDPDSPTGYDICDYKVPLIFEDTDMDTADLMQIMVERLPKAAVRKDAQHYMPTEDTVHDYMFTTVAPTDKPGGLDLAVHCQKMRASKLLTKMGFHELKKSNQGDNKNHGVPAWTIWLVWKPSSDSEKKQRKRKLSDDVDGRRKKERGCIQQ